MNNKVFTWIAFFVVFLVHVSFAQTNTANPAWARYISLQNHLTPFWKADTIYNESVLPVGSGNNHPEARLLFKAKKIIAIKDSYLQKEYKKGKDWKYRDGKIVLTRKSAIPYFTKDELFFTGKKAGVSMESNTAGHFVLFSESGLLQSKQLSVTYIKDPGSRWQGKLPVYAEEQLPNIFSKLKTGTPVNILFYGNSIEAGANSSITLNKPPFLPTWPEMIIENLRSRYGGSIQYKNKSKGGMLASWGVENASSLLNTENPDLVVIGFGMNDGTFKVAPDVFAEQIKHIMQQVKTAHPSCEFIVITPMLANPDAMQSRIQKEYQQPLLHLQHTGIAIADMTAIHEELLRHKAYQDMTGNNVNHPNDYLARWYAQVVSALLIP
ncbi:SGNH/GDSL hydrolase family protein [Agriterribacter sp.]|uniref:SGNH/GDSL hydrolase family protein n=1 Tax=Agriterribacter sp. TaxID=2821509 RepID=UPI002C2E67AD|nr:SGNH/GDSL hydrolase family protein [Agriterribacter sp.]HTN08311.1 SGNH/GDSL hydrolase family protein [Agriterribacter sp.]